MKSAGFAIVFLFFSSMISLSGFAETAGKSQVGWKDPSGKELKDTDSRKSKNGFGGWVILTDDLHWQKEWQKPQSHAPFIKAAREVKKGKPVELLVFFSNPKLDKNKHANVRTEISIILPNGKSDVIQTDGDCYNGSMPENTFSVFVCRAATQFMAEPTDPSGEWKFEVTLKDKTGGTNLYLSTPFRVK